MRDVITGDAVVVELPLAQLATRSIAFAIDVAIMAALYGLLLLLFSAAGVFDADDALTAALAVGAGVLVFVGIPVTLETLTRGRTLGKLAMGLRVVRDDGGPIRFRHALARGLAGLVVDFGVFSFFTAAVALISSLVSRRGKRVGDMLAGTVVVRERAPAAAGSAVGMPPRLAGWASSLALSQLPDPLALSVRQFVTRAPDLDPGVRTSMAASLATEVSGLVSPPPPPGTAAEAYLAAVLAERTRRETERLAGPAAPPVPVPPPAAQPPAGDGFSLPQ